MGNDVYKREAYELLRKKDFYSPFTFAGYQLKKEYMPLRQSLNERRYTTKDTGVPHRVIHHWDKHRLLPEGAETGETVKNFEWRRFTLVEMVWLKIIQHLRDFGLPLKQIAVVKDGIVYWNAKTEVYPFLEYCLAQACFSSKDIYLRIFADGNAKLVSSDEVEMRKILGESKDMILIPIKPILAEMGMTFPDIKSRLELRDEEFALLYEIWEKNNDEIRAKIKDRKIIELESTAKLPTTAKDYDIRKEAESEGMYGRVIAQYEDGKKRSVSITKRTRFPKKDG